jgi:type I restriction enzyme M protein
MANPPFNVDRVDKERLKDDPRFPFGMPRTDNANYLWIQIFYSALNDKGRAGSSWPTPPPTPAAPSWRSAGN